MKKPIIIIIAILLIAGALWYYFYPGTDPLVEVGLKKAQPPLNPNTVPTGTSGNQKDSNGFPLSMGSRGTYVKSIQKALNDQFATGLVLDGIWGPKTQKALTDHNYPSSIDYEDYFQILQS